MQTHKAENSQGTERRIRLTDDLLWGTHPVTEALEQEAERITEIILQKEKKGGKWEKIIGLARLKGIKLTFVSALRLTGPESAQVRHQGIVARTCQTSLLPFADLLEKYAASVKKGGHPCLIACDSLQDPHNLGAIIRSAHASGCSGVVITRERSAPLGGTAAKASAGAISHIDISQVTNLAESLKQLKEAGAWIFGAVKDAAAQSIFTTDFALPACIVVGGEGQGIRPLVRKHCDVLISIPMVGMLDSLNSSVAAGIIMFEVLRQKTSKDRGRKPEDSRRV
jgi:23S rRNA (guanosine2251-2'-O)-methyltransferase